jgi:hypothetical protein
MTVHGQLRENLMQLVSSSPHQRVRPTDAKQTLGQETGISRIAINAVLKKLVDDGDLVYSYRDPCSYVEIPCNGCEGGHRAARPMQVVADAEGNRWLCDDDADLGDGLPGQSCWECDGQSFTRAG